MKTITKQLIVFASLTLSLGAFAQNTEGVSIKSTLAPPHPSAMLDVEHSSKGVLIPRVALTSMSSASPVTGPTTGLFVYNTNNDNVNLKGTGFYYWNSALGTSGQWVKLGESAKMAQVSFTAMMDLIANSGFQDEDQGLMVFCTTRDVVMAASIVVSSSQICTGDGTNNHYNTYGVWYLSKEELCPNTTPVFVWRYIDNSPRGKVGAQVGTTLHCEGGPCTLQQ